MISCLNVKFIYKKDFLIGNLMIAEKSMKKQCLGYLKNQL